ncbi:hypothetical protein COO60DRAFT_1530326 [Scenedesmus sp. NREL 46B-D3]|nr:hypothetical protein COO60DRAFT_1530326 [Scenedesmus sp. NREL 46B-D3]
MQLLAAAAVSCQPAAAAALLQLLRCLLASSSNSSSSSVPTMSLCLTRLPGGRKQFLSGLSSSARLFRALGGPGPRCWHHWLSRGLHAPCTYERAAPRRARQLPART